MSDIMDEFEFKPLTDGLGFHKKNQTEKSNNGDRSEKLEKPSSLFTQEPMKAQFDLGGELSNPLSTPLPRTQRQPAEKIPVSNDLPSTTVDEILKTLNDRKRPSFQQPQVKTKIEITPEAPVFRSTAWDFSAFLLDLMLVLAINLVCLILLLVTTKVDLFANLYNPDTDNMIFISMGVLFLGTSWMYLVMTRVFMGCTPGEWIFDQRLGLPEETGSAMYSLLVVARAVLILATGLVIFPLISAFANHDVLGRWMGLELMKRS